MYSSSLPMKPNIGGAPALDRAASNPAVAVHGIRRRRPPRVVTSRVPDSWSTLPATMNSAALYSAWATRNTTAVLIAYVVPTPISIVRIPSTATVE